MIRFPWSQWWKKGFSWWRKDRETKVVALFFAASLWFFLFSMMFLSAD